MTNLRSYQYLRVVSLKSGSELPTHANFGPSSGSTRPPQGILNSLASGKADPGHVAKASHGNVGSCAIGVGGNLIDQGCGGAGAIRKATFYITYFSPLHLVYIC
jgi:hypothetical protein